MDILYKLTVVGVVMLVVIRYREVTALLTSAVAAITRVFSLGTKGATS